MTKHELLLMSAYTGYLFCDMDDLHKFIEEILERPVFTHEFDDDDIWDELQEKLRPEIEKIICEVKNEN